MFGNVKNFSNILLISRFHDDREFHLFRDCEYILCMVLQGTHTPIFSSTSQSSTKLWSFLVFFDLLQCGSHLESQNCENLILSLTCYRELPHTF